MTKEEKIEQVILSVVIPVYNTLPFLQNTIRSISNQNNDSVEVIFVDDASTDGSHELLKKYIQERPNFKIITHDTNKGTHISRIDGAGISTGEYIWFVDGDDTIPLGTFANFIDILAKDDSEIIQFGCNIINEGLLDASRVESMQEFTKPYNGKLKGKEIFKACFIENKYRFNIWNKLFKKELIMKSFVEMEKSYFPKAQDKYEYFILSNNAVSYSGYPDIIGYEYHFGNGITGHNRLTPEQFRKYCDMSAVSDAIYRYSKDKGEVCMEASIKNRLDLFEDCITNWYRVPIESRNRAFEDLVNAWGQLQVISELSKRNWYNQEEIARSVRQSPIIQSSKTNIQTVATYYHKMYNGGIQRAISGLLGIWKKLGYNLILITDEPPTDYDYPLPSGVKRIQIESYYNTTRDNYGKRAESLIKILKDNGVDIFVNHAWVANTLLWDMLICKTCGIKFVTYCHNVFPMLERNGFTYFASLPHIYRLMDGVITLSEVDMKFWSYFNHNTFLVQNPLTFNPDNIKPSMLNEPNILWLGRMAPEKKPKAAVDIFEIVHRIIPKATMTMVGDGTGQFMREIRERISSKNLDECIKLEGFSTDVLKHYQNSSIFLATSEFEGFMLTLAESLSVGVPVVMYDLPYLDILRNGKGFVIVPQKDMNAAAEAICKILKDEDYRKKLGLDGRDYAKQLCNYDYDSKWKEIFERLTLETSSVADETTDLMWDTLLSFYRTGIERKNQSTESVKKTVSYRVGRAMTYIPRKLLKYE